MSSPHPGSGDHGDMKSNWATSRSPSAGGPQHLGTGEPVPVVLKPKKQDYTELIARMQADSLRASADGEEFSAYLAAMQEEFKRRAVIPVEVLDLEDCLEECKEVLAKDELVKAERAELMKPVDVCGPEAINQSFLKYTVSGKGINPETGKPRTVKCINWPQKYIVEEQPLPVHHKKRNPFQNGNGSFKKENRYHEGDTNNVDYYYYN